MRNFDQKSESAPENCPTAGSADAESGVVFSSSFTGFTEITNFVNSSVFPIAPINVSEEPANTAKPIVYPSKPLGDFETQVFGYLDLFKNMLHDSISLAVVYHKDSQSAKGLMVLWAASTLSRTSSASARQLQDDLQAATPLVHNAAIVQTIQPVVNSSVNVFALGLVNSRRVADVIVSTETALKQAVLVNRASVVITKNIVLTSTLTISSGTVTVSSECVAHCISMIIVSHIRFC